MFSAATLEEIEKLEIPNLERYFENIKIPTKRVHFKIEHGEKTVIEIDKLVPTKHVPPKTPIQIISEHIKGTLPEIYNSYMMNTLSLETWKNFIIDFFEEIEEYYEEIIDEPYYRKNELLYEKLISLVHDFYIEYGFYEIEKLVKWKEYGNFEILRRIRHYCRNWESFFKKDLPSSIYYFKLQHWEYFFKCHSIFTKKMYDTEKMISKVLIWKPLFFPVRLLSDIGENYYSFFSWKTIILRSVPNNNEIEITTSILKNYFHNDSHFEGDIFWFENEIPYYVYYDNEKISENEYNFHKENHYNQKKGILQCPYHLLAKHHKERLKTFCTNHLLSPKLWNFLDSNSKQPLEEILKKCFHILGRIIKKYRFYQYHDTLSHYLENNYLVLNKLYSCPVSIVFPEYDIQTDSIKKEWKKQWNYTFSFFKNETLSFLFNENYDTSIYIEPIPFFKKKEYTDDKEYIFSLLNKRKTYYQYFSIKDLLMIERESSTIEVDSLENNSLPLDNSQMIEQIDNYIRECISYKNGK